MESPTANLPPEDVNSTAGATPIGDNLPQFINRKAKRRFMAQVSKLAKRTKTKLKPKPRGFYSPID